MTAKRKVPHHVTGTVKSGKQQNAKIREIVRKLVTQRVTDLLTIYGALNEIADITHACDKDIDQIEIDARESVAAWNRMVDETEGKK